MEVKTKSSLLIIGSLIIGILIGSIATITIIKPKGHRINMKEKGRFSDRMMDIIGPKEEQKEAIMILLKTYEEKMIKHQQYSMNVFRLKADSLKTELGTLLDEEQMARVEKYYSDRKARYKKRKERVQEKRNKMKGDE